MDSRLFGTLAVAAAISCATVCIDPRWLSQSSRTDKFTAAQWSEEVGAHSAETTQAVPVAALVEYAVAPYAAPEYSRSPATRSAASAGTGALIEATLRVANTAQQATTLRQAERLVDDAIAAHAWKAVDAQALGLLQLELPAAEFQRLLAKLIPCINRQELRLVDVDEIVL